VPRNVYAWTLGAAADTVGRERLAARLRVSDAQLGRWLAGIEQPPVEAFMDSLDLIADGPFAEGRPPRVAVLDPRKKNR
jgi:hypothetical protein